MPVRRRLRPLSSQDKAFFQGFYETYKGFLFYAARQYAPDDCEDIVQDSIVRLMGNVDRLRELSPGSTAKYIALTVRSAYLDAEKRKSRQQEIPTENSILEVLIAQDPMPSGQPSSAVLMELKQSLSAKDWLLLEGKYIQGYSQEELGRLIGVSPDSIRMILHRARRKARTILLSDDGGESNE